ncbi:GAP family protein [Nocardia cyriacigeorgica]|uniref:GAP family protein n=1 Tax=Nocardia cyriacigeorgica TaxID=135487 RepID=UPI002457ECE8|nr:GAP family protein [Nocardia cyriacigeorgica]
MGELFVLLLPEMIGLLITPGAVAGTVLLLQSRHPIRNAASFAAAFLLVYTQIAVAALLGGATDPGATSKNVSHWAGLIVGLLFIVAGVLLLVRTGRQERTAPKWLTELEDASARRAFAIGLALGVLNPNVFIMMSGMSIVASSSTTVAIALTGTVLLLLAAALDFAVPIAFYQLMGERARHGLDAAKEWMVANTRLMTIAVLFGFGALFTVRGLVNLG